MVYSMGGSMLHYGALLWSLAGHRSYGWMVFLLPFYGSKACLWYHAVSLECVGSFFMIVIGYVQVLFLVLRVSSLDVCSTF